MSRRLARLGLLAPPGLAILAAWSAAGPAWGGRIPPGEARAWRVAQGVPPAITAGSPRNARLQARDGAATTFFTPGGFTAALFPRQGQEDGWAIRWSVAGSPAAPIPEGALPGRRHFLVGPSRRWRRDVPAFSRVRYPALAAGLTGLIEPAAGGVRWSVLGDPRALSRLWLRYEGVTAATVSPDGRALALRTGLGTLTETLPPGARYARLRPGPTPGTFEYQLDPGAGAQGALPGTFTAGLAWSGFLAGAQNRDDSVNELSLAPDGAIVVVGETTSPDYPVTAGKLKTTLLNQDVHVTRVAPDGTLVWATFLGGDASSENGEGVLVEPGGQILVIGRTRSTDFPVTALVFDRTFNGPAGGGDAFLSKLAADGTALVWSTYLGGSGEDYGLALARGSGGEVYAAGWTGSGDFPQFNAFDSTFGGLGCPTTSCDGWMAGLSPDGRSLLFSSFYGGAGYDTVEDLAIDGAQALYMVGSTGSSTDLPLSSNGFDRTYGGGTYDGYLLKVTTSGLPAIDYATYLGGSAPDSATSVLLDPGGGMVVAGATSSQDFPLVPGLGRSPSGGGDAFVLRLTPAGDALSWSSLLGGGLLESVRKMALGPQGAIHLAGITGSSDFPATRAFETAFGGADDAWVARLSPDGAALDFASFVGGSGTDDGRCLEVDRRGNVYVGGTTSSPDFPRTALRPAGALKDGFLFKVDATPPDGGVVRDGLGADLAFQQDATTLSASWLDFADPDTSLARYEWALGTGPSLEDVRPFADAGSSTSATASGLGLAVGRTYYATVRAYNRAGARVEVPSDGVRIVLQAGAPCTDPSQCPAFCTNGVCCAVAACPSCQSCDVGAGGTCGPVANGTSCSNGIFCDGPDDRCAAGACVGGPQVVCPGTDAGEPAVCDEAVQACVPIPTPPVIAGVPPATALAGRPYRYTLVATGSPPITFGFCRAPPAGMTLDPATGDLQWTPLLPGVAPVCVEARNGAGADQRSFEIAVQVATVQPGEVVLEWTPPAAPDLLGERQDFTLRVRSTLAVEASGVRAALEPSGLELVDGDGGLLSSCGSPVRGDLPPIPPGVTVELPVSGRFCAAGGGGTRLVARLEDPGGGRLTGDLVHDFQVKARFDTTCGCSGGAGGPLALAALCLALALRLSRRA